MNRMRLWSIVLLALAASAFALLPVAALGHRLAILPLRVSFNLLGAGALLAVLVACVSIYQLVRTLKAHASRDTALVAGALVLCLVHLAVLGTQAVRGFGVPPIHDITTDGVDVPQFDVVQRLRKATENPLVYGDGMSPAEHLALQRNAYPDIVTRHVAMDVDEAFERALAVLKAQGLEVVGEDRAAGRIEAVATTFWFGFKDDVVVRIQRGKRDTEIDVRSVSRVGKSDLGTNAARIRRLLEAIGT